MTNENRHYFQKWWFWTAIILLVLLIGFYFRTDVKAKVEGVDKKYFENPRYCEQDSDCSQQATCGPVNIFNYETSGGDCERATCGSECVNNQCQFKKCEWDKKYEEYLNSTK